MGISKNLVFYGLNPSPFFGREGYKEFLEVPYSYIPKCSLSIISR